MEKPGTVTFLAKRSPMEPLVSMLAYQMSASGENYSAISFENRNEVLEAYHANNENLGLDLLTANIHNLLLDNGCDIASLAND